METVEKLFRERRSVLTSEFYGRCVEHVKRVEEKYSETDGIVDLKIDQLLITIRRESVTGMEAAKTNRIRNIFVFNKKEKMTISQTKHRI